MTKSNKLVITTIWIFILLMKMSYIAMAQNDVTHVQVKAYDQKLNPLSGVQITIDQDITFTTSSKGLAFIQVPDSSLPPKQVDILKDDLEAVSWNYSRGVLEILFRQKRYERITVRFIDFETGSPIQDLTVKIKNQNSSNLATDRDGKISAVIPGKLNPIQDNIFAVKGYQIQEQRFDNGELIVSLKKISARETYPSQNSMVSVEQNEAIDKSNATDFSTIKQIAKGDLDSVEALSAFYSLLKNINYNLLDETSKRLIDEKYNQLIEKDTSIDPRNSLELITDSSLIDQDIQLILEKIYYERDMLNQSVEEFGKATDHISEKLKNGGTNLSEQERKDLIKLVLSIQEMLKRNEEIFNRNNDFYQREVDNLLNQLTNIYELEDMLKESEELSSELRRKLIYSTVAFIAILAITLLLVYLVRVLRKQKQELTAANEEIRVMNENLEGIVYEKTKSLEMINNELDTFMYRSSHNLRRPITSIRGLANIAQITLDKEGIGLFDKVVLTANEMEKMLNKLAMMSYINQPTDFGIINLKTLIDRIAEEFEAIIKEKNITFNISIASGIRFKSYPFVLESVLLNFIENALFFSKCQSNAEALVDLNVGKDEEGELKISIRDNGCGIKQEVIDKIWNMFFVGNEASKGNGLGLFIAKKGLDLLKGKVIVNTVEGKFTEFVITLPEIAPSKQSFTSHTISSIQ